MRSKTKLSRLITFISAMLCLLVISDILHFQSVVSAQTSAAEENIEGEDESTCSLDPSTSNGDCTTTDDDNDANIISTHQLNSLTRQVIPLTDNNFDELTLTSTPATWLIMFKTNSCGICKKVKPVWDDLSMDIDIIKHNERELSIVHELNKEQQSSTEEKDKKPPISVYKEEEITTTTTDEDDNSPPTGPVYIATIDAGWSGKDTTLQFSIDATPTIILLRNKGYNNNKFNKDEVDDPRSYYIYRGQRAIYPLRQFILGGYKSRKQIDMPPPLLKEERKPTTLYGRIYDYLVSSTTKWIGGIVGKVLLVWFVFIGGLGLFLRIHNYAWGDNADDDNNNDNSQREIEEEKAKGRKEYDMSQDAQDERSIRRQKIMWERKAKNHEKFAANREARNKKKKEEDDDDDEMEGVGFSVKKKDAMKNNTSGTKKKNSNKSKDN